MTVDEARSILNLGKATEAASQPAEQSELMKQLLENYERMMAANEKTSHYIQSKIVRARERLEAEYPECVHDPLQTQIHR
jgi:import inner membrane translocase subunit TIM16